MRTDAESRSVEIAAQLSVIEIALGSLVHALKIPFGGHALSLNQGLFLCRSAETSKDRREAVQSACLISAAAATFKSLSPAGNRLGPMLSISAQGMLFSLGILAFGAGVIGQIAGMLLLSPWAFLQPILTLYLFYGADLLYAGAFYWQKLKNTSGISADAFEAAVIAAIALKFLLAAAIPLGLRHWGTHRTEETTRRWAGWAKNRLPRHRSPSATHRDAFRGAARDLMKPLFLVSLLLMAVFIFCAESKKAEIIWKLLRPVAIAFLFFYFSRSPWLPAVIARLRRIPGLRRFFRFAEKASPWRTATSRKPTSSSRKSP